MVMVMMTLFSTTSCGRNEKITRDPSVLPEKAQQFLKDHFSDAQLLQIKYDRKITGKEFEVILSSAREIEFDKKGDWMKVDCRPMPVPTSFIPEKILEFVGGNHASTPIVAIERDKLRYEVEVSNGVEIHFNPYGEFISYD